MKNTECNYPAQGKEMLIVVKFELITTSPQKSRPIVTDPEVLEYLLSKGLIYVRLVN